VKLKSKEAFRDDDYVLDYAIYKDDKKRFV
jgi:hypothetical protein